MSIAPGDAVALTRELVRIDSRNPGIDPGGPGEVEVARCLADVLAAWGLRPEIREAAPGRPCVIARAGRAGEGARTLMFNGHVDVVGVEGMRHAPFDAEQRDGRIYGRGAADMKGGVAAMCAAATRAADAVAGELVITAVADEEDRSIGTRRLVDWEIRADAAIVTEPTRLAIAPAHRGFAWLEITVHGRAAHGSRYDLGIDAIRLAGLLLAELDLLEERELTTRTHPLLGHASLHASLIEGGIGMSTYPDRCVVKLERRTLPGEGVEMVEAEVAAAIARVRSRRPAMRADVRVLFAQDPSDVSTDAPIVRALHAAAAAQARAPAIEGLSAWTDCAILNAAGIPAICYGPGDIALAHSAEEWVPVEEVEQCTRVLAELATRWCGEQAWHS